MRVTGPPISHRPLDYKHKHQGERIKQHALKKHMITIIKPHCPLAYRKRNKITQQEEPLHGKQGVHVETNQLLESTPRQFLNNAQP